MKTKRFFALLLVIVMTMGTFSWLAAGVGALKNGSGQSMKAPWEDMVAFALSQEGKTGNDYAATEGISFEWCVWFTTYCASNVGLCGNTSDYACNVFPPVERSTWQANSWAATGVPYQVNWLTQNNKGSFYYFGDLGKTVTPNENIYSSSQDSYIPQSGDLVYFDWEHDNYYNHVAIVYSFEASTGTVSYIGGNQGDGDVTWRERAVSRISISKNSAEISGYLRPDYPIAETNGISIAAYDGVSYKIEQLKGTFAPGRYWNHYVSNAQDHIDYTGFWTWNYMDCVTDHKCTSHSSSASTGYYDCNCFNGGAQCWGFANRIFYGVFGQLCSDLSRRTDIDNIRVGDHVRFTSWGNDGHSAIVWSRNGDYILLYECNASGSDYCKIRADRTVSISSSGIVGFYQATNWDEVNQSHNTSVTLDINGRLNGESKGTLQNFGTVDVYINGNKVADDVNDYYETLPSGTNYEIKDIKPNSGYSYDGVYSGNRLGTLSANSTVVFTFTANDFSVVTESPERVPFNGHTYLYYSTPVTWYFAKEFCESQGGHLAAVTSGEENAFVTTLFPSETEAWIGGTDYGTSNQWRWITGESFTYTNWNTGEPNENASADTPTEDYIHYTTTGLWNDSRGCVKRGFVLEIDGLDHYHNIELVPAMNPTCTEPGNIGYYHCTGCGEMYLDAAGNVVITAENVTIPAIGHNYIEEAFVPNCLIPAGIKHVCSRCGDFYYEFPEENCTEWSTEYPTGIAEELIESCTEYRYRDHEVTTSYESTMPGWVQTGSEWQQSGSGTINYVASWPAGFDHNHSLYSTYNKTPKTATETATDKTVINSDTIMGYIYWHWCRNQLTNGPSNRLIELYYTEEFCCFHAFYSTTNPATLYDYGGGVYQFSNGDCCLDSYWYFAFPVQHQTWTSYKKLFTYERWTDWSEWSATPVENSENREVETRTVYRYVNDGFGDHVWDEGVVTTQPTYTNNGIVTYTCTLCGATHDESIPHLEAYTVTFVDWDGTVLASEIVPAGEAAQAPEVPGREGYTFIGWDTDFSFVTTDLTVTALYEQNAPSQYLKGDVKCDGIVDSADITLAAAYSMSAGEVTAQGVINGDMNGDGFLTAADLSALYSYIQG